MGQRYMDMQTALESMVFNYAHFGRVTEHFMRDVSRMLGETAQLIEDFADD
jgi:hypothetical protein